jgi:glycopeptide antibiotics resistance protein
MLSLPYKDMRSDGFNKTDILQNIIFFIPFGALLSAIILKKCMTDYFVLFLVVIFSGGLLSFVIECLQLFLPTRNPGIADIFCNVLGSVFGIFVALIMLKEKS